MFRELRSPATPSKQKHFATIQPDSVFFRSYEDANISGRTQRGLLQVLQGGIGLPPEVKSWLGPSWYLLCLCPLLPQLDGNITETKGIWKGDSNLCMRV